MKTYEIEDYSGNSTINMLADGPVYYAQTGRKALDQHLKKIGFKGKVKCSADRDVHFKVTPIYIDGRGTKWIDRRKGQRALWYQIVPQKIN
jgi:hypothetical protein